MRKRETARAGGRTGLGDRGLVTEQHRGPLSISFDGAPPPSSLEMVAVGLLLPRLRHAPIWKLLRPSDHAYIFQVLGRGLTPYTIAAVDDKLFWIAIEAGDWGELWAGPAIPPGALLVKNKHGLWRIIDDFVSPEMAAAMPTRGRA
jgi:hypothetical protein